jgi:AcrR family transcriptional regulator
MDTITDTRSKKQIILEAAARLFRDKGYSATSMRDLARAVDLKASSLYNHIESKEALLQEICFNNAHRFLQGMTEVEKMKAGHLEKIKALIRLHIEIATRDVTSVTAFNDEWRHLKDPHLSHFMQLRKEYEHRFLALLEAGIKQGELKDLDARVMLYTLFSSMRWVYDWLRKDRHLEVEQLEAQITTLLLSGMEK